jgi:hypothetical protein
LLPLIESQMWEQTTYEAEAATKAYLESRERADHAQQAKLSNFLEKKPPKQTRKATAEQCKEWENAVVAALQHGSSLDDCVTAFAACSVFRKVTVWQKKFSIFFLCCSILDCHPLQLLYGDSPDATLPQKINGVLPQ